MGREVACRVPSTHAPAGDGPGCEQGWRDLGGGNRERSRSLKKLDKNGDGKLAEDELLPEGARRFGGPGPVAGGGPQHGGFEQGGRPGGPGQAVLVVLVKADRVAPVVPAASLSSN